MTTKAKTKAGGKIDVKSYEPVTYDEPKDGPKLSEIRVTETFTGDVQGDGTVRFLQAQRADGSASYCGIERIIGALAGRKGTFLLQDEGTLQGSKVKGTWFVIPGSGTGDLHGLRGEGGFEAELGQHASWTLDYWFE
jgi:hypothetical protein